MTWHRKLPRTIYLNDGRAIATLAQARDVMLTLPRQRQAGPHWQDAAQLLMDAAYRQRQEGIVDAHAQLARAFEAEGLL